VNQFPWVTVLLVATLVGALGVACVPKGNRELAKRAALGWSLAILVYSIVMALQFHAHDGLQFTETHTWIAAFGAHYAVGVDGLGLSLVLLTTILTPVVILAGWNDGDPVETEGREGAVQPRWSTRSFFAWTLALEALAIGCFVAVDVFMFYVLFEIVLLPVYFLIGGFGGAGRTRAAVKFLQYSLTGGLIMLAAVIGVYVESAKVTGHPTYLLSELTKIDFSHTAGRWLFLGFFIAFAIKAPLFPVHTWLPDACQEATPGTNTLLVSVLDKIGSFGMIRFCLELFPEASRWATPVVVVIAVISIIYGALMAIGSDNIPRLIAYTSVSHFGFIVLGIFVMNSQGLSGADLYMFAHGLSTAAVFLVGGFLTTRGGSKLVSSYGGVEKVAPVLAGLFLVGNLSLLSLPGLSPFVPEFLSIVGSFAYSPWAAAFAVTGIVLAAIYALLTYQRTMTGPTRPELIGMSDLNVREIASVVPVVALLLVLGFAPQPLLHILNPSAQHTMSEVGQHDPAPKVSRTFALNQTGGTN
jgi:NADH-quinone oxidoreductase subunit M